MSEAPHGRDNFHKPNSEEQAFLAIATAHSAPLGEQVAACEMSDYDPDGFVDIRVLDGPAGPAGQHISGAILSTGLTETPRVETLLWLGDNGLLDTIEFVFIGAPLDDVYGRFVRGAGVGLVTYPES